MISMIAQPCNIQYKKEYKRHLKFLQSLYVYCKTRSSKRMDNDEVHCVLDRNA